MQSSLLSLYMQFSVDNKTNVNFTYPVWKSLCYDQPRSNSLETQLHTFHDQDIVNTDVNAETH